MTEDNYIKLTRKTTAWPSCMSNRETYAFTSRSSIIERQHGAESHWTTMHVQRHLESAWLVMACMHGLLCAHSSVSIKHLLKGLCQSYNILLHQLLSGHVTARKRLYGSNGTVSNATGNNQTERVQICCQVDGYAMVGDPLLHPDSYGCHLLAINPDPSQTWYASASQTGYSFQAPAAAGRDSILLV